MENEVNDMDHVKCPNCHSSSIFTIDEDGNIFYFMGTNSVKVGVCVKYIDGTREILIRESSWNSYSSRKQEILIFHELGHCALDRSHDEERYKGYKVSLMSPQLINQVDYTDFYDQYIRELFSSNKSELEFSIDSI